VENGYTKETLTTSNTKLAAVLLVFGARLRRHLPLEWTDLHETREAFLRYLENSSVSKPKQCVVWNFENSVPAAEIVKAYEKDLQALYADLEKALEALDDQQKNVIRDACSKVIARAAREALEQREFLVKLLKSVPQSAKYDEVHNGSKVPFVKIGKNSSPELRARMLAKL
jgi:hypothetical protein